MYRQAAALAGVVALALPGLAAHAADPSKLQWGIVQAAAASPYKAGCTATSRVWAKEFGVSGITRLRARWELRSPRDPGYLPTYVKTPYATSGSFPDDARSFYMTPLVLAPGAANFSRGVEFALWVKVVGERPSFWKPDLVSKGNLGIVACALLDVEGETVPQPARPGRGGGPAPYIPPAGGGGAVSNGG